MNDPRIEAVMRNFDFGKVAAAMHVLGWKWHYEPENGGPRRPSLSDMHDHAMKYLSEAVKEGAPYCTQCGGFEVDLDRRGNLSLRFIVESQDSIDYD